MNDTPANEQTFAALIRERYDEAGGPLSLSMLCHEVLPKLPNAKSSQWFGMGTFRTALDSLWLPHAGFSGRLLWNADKQPSADWTTPNASAGEGSVRPASSAIEY